jgi:hypothetical protein
VAYLLDANVFIEAKNRHYGFDFCPAFWDWLVASNAKGKVFSIERVSDELQAGSDELAGWAEGRGADFFLKPDTAIIPALSSVSEWAAGEKFEPAAVSTFLAAADFYLLAHARAHGYAVVTHEVARSSTKTIKIPNVCISLGIKCMTPFEMLRLEKARFVLSG